MSAGRQNRSVSFAGGAKAGATVVPAESAANVKQITSERVTWQNGQV